AQDFELQQPQDKVSVTAGEMLNLTCTTSGVGPTGPVKWLKGWDGGNETIYEQKGTFPRVMRVVSESDTEFSIRIRDVRPEDAGTYYCVNTAVVTLQEDDVRSQLICEVLHSTLTAPLRGMYQLSKALRVSPSVSVVADVPSPVEVNKTMNFTCHVKGFYPGDVAVTWLENGMEIKVENISQPVETPRGLFELRSLVEVQATEEKNGSVFTCRVVHDAQDPVSGTATLWIAAPARG
ncbi:SIRBL protein, partial [Circaetus pectoralis]|nr:SIRBL protein [Circaetus pectoralis]